MRSTAPRASGTVACAGISWKQEGGAGRWAAACLVRSVKVQLLGPHLRQRESSFPLWDQGPESAFSRGTEGKETVAPKSRSSR